MKIGPYSYNADVVDQCISQTCLQGKWLCLISTSVALDYYAVKLLILIYPQRIVSKKRIRKCESGISHTIRVLKLVLDIPVINLVVLNILKIFLFAKLQYLPVYL